MTDQQWKHLQDELKTITKAPIDSPSNPAQFKERVLQEYERRNRQEQRGQWVNRTLTGLALGAAIWTAVVLTTGPLQQLDHNASRAEQSQSAQNAQKANTITPEQMMKYDAKNVTTLPDRELQLQYPDQEPNWQNQMNIPQEKRLDLTQEAGIYVTNGSVESFSIAGNELHIELRRERGRVQILSVPYTMLYLAQGQQIQIKAFDENGNVVGVPRTINLP